MKNNKSQLLIPLIIILVVTLSIAYQIFGKNQFRDEFSSKKKRVLVEKYYVNYAWKTEIKEVVIFNDGTIYTWNQGKDKMDGNINAEEGLRSILLKQGKKEKLKVKKTDLIKLEKYIKSLENSIVLRNAGADIGTAAIAVWRDNKKIDIKVTGDNYGENKTDSSKAIIKITDKYLKKYLKSYF